MLAWADLVQDRISCIGCMYFLVARTRALRGTCVEYMGVPIADIYIYAFVYATVPWIAAGPHVGAHPTSKGSSRHRNGREGCVVWEAGGMGGRGGRRGAVAQTCTSTCEDGRANSNARKRSSNSYNQ